MSEPVIVSAVRTAIGRFRGSLKDVHSADLGSTVAKAALERAGIEPASIEKAVHELRRIGGGAALLTMCIGGGQGIAIVDREPPGTLTVPHGLPEGRRV